MAKGRLTVAVFHEAAGWSLSGEALEPLRAAAPPDLAVSSVASLRELREALPETTRLVIASLPLDWTTERSPGLRWAHFVSPSGESPATIERLLEAGVRVTSGSRARAPQAAEHALMLALALLRQLPSAIAAQQSHAWATADLAKKVRDLRGSTIGVIGLGPIGAAAAQRFALLGCETLAAGAETLEAPLEGVETSGLAALDELLARSDVVIATPPLAPRAGPLLDRSAFDSFKRSAVLVDISRPGLVEEAALVRALRRGLIAGAAIDVAERAPPSPDWPLWTLSNVIATPTLSIVSPHCWSDAVELAAENLRRLEHGQALLDEISAEGAAIATAAAAQATA